MSEQPSEEYVEEQPWPGVKVGGVLEHLPPLRPDTKIKFGEFGVRRQPFCMTCGAMLVSADYKQAHARIIHGVTSKKEVMDAIQELYNQADELHSRINANEAPIKYSVMRSMFNRLVLVKRK